VLLLFLILFKDRRVVEQTTVYDEVKTTLEAPGTAVPQDKRPRP
jgi:hypothetical protein